MLFNSYSFLLVFLPITVTGYFVIRRFLSKPFGIAWLTLCSLFFYGIWNPWYVPLIVGSILGNYFIGNQLLKRRGKPKQQRWLLIFGVTGNLALLGYYKYTDFFLSNVNTLLEKDFTLLHLALPIGISFFTFQQIAYLVDNYMGLTDRYRFLDYSFFVLFFPQLIAGPIVHYKEILPQLSEPVNRKADYDNLNSGIYLLALGLFKKVIIADTLARWTIGLDTNMTLTFFEGWFSIISYTFQIYFDFSGYSDMAIGLGKLFNIQLPQNFNSPYKALNIQDFWRRWHITLSRFMRDYIYIPLGGNRVGLKKNLLITFAVFLIGGLWHGAAWTFVVWGILHGLAFLIFRLWSLTQIVLPKVIAWTATFVFVCMSWVFFRSETLARAFDISQSLIGLNGFLPHPKGILSNLEPFFSNQFSFKIIIILVLFCVLVFGKSSLSYVNKFKPTNWYLLQTVGILIIVLLSLNNVTEFIYFNF